MGRWEPGNEAGNNLIVPRARERAHLLFPSPQPPRVWLRNQKRKGFFQLLAADYCTRGFSNSYLELKEQKGCEQIEIYFSKI